MPCRSSPAYSGAVQPIPAESARLELFAGVADQVEKGVVGLADRAVLVHHQNAHHVRASQAAKAGVAGTQRFFGAAAGRNVPEHPLDADDVSVRIVDRRLEHLDVDRLALGLAMFFHVLKNAPRGEHPRVVFAIFFRQVLRKQVIVGLPREFIPGLADLVEVVLVGVDQAAVEVLAKHVEREAFHQRSVPRLGVP